MRSSWDPEQYERFRAERSQPFHDLLAMVAATSPPRGLRVLDLGCGTGELTRRLHDELGAASTLGIDSSETMLARGAERAAPAHGELELRRERIEDLSAEGGRFDLVFSNAALHWIDDHPRLLARVARLVAPEGRLAVQVPANHDHPSHTVAAELAREAPFRAELDGWVRVSNVLAPEVYATLLEELGFREQRTRLEVYPHRLPGAEDVVEWVKGTLLTAYQERLSAGGFELFLSRYRERLLAALGDARPFFYPFKRILFVACR